MTNFPAVQTQADVIERVMIEGDLSALTSDQRATYYMRVCSSLGLNPLTKPFAYLKLNGKLVLYALKDCTEQLRKINGVSIVSLQESLSEGVFIVKAQARDKSGRDDMATGAVAIEGLKGEAKANAMMKAETKAKRRVTLSVCGLGMLDETEVETIPGAVAMPVEVTAEPHKALAAPVASKPAAEPVIHAEPVTVDMSWYPAKEVAEADAKAEQDAEPPFKQCPLHDVPMDKRQKNGHTFYSHRVGNGDWCNGEVVRKAKTATASVSGK
jgi:hypothetical protein